MQKLAPVYVLLGTERYLVQSFVEAVLNQLATETGQSADLNRFSFEEDGCQSVIAACETVSLFASASVQVLDNCTALLPSGRTKVKPERADTTALETYVTAPAPDHVLIVTAVGEKFDERKKVTKAMRAHAVVIDCNTPADATALEILQQAAEKQATRIAKSVLAELYRRSGSISMAVSDLRKTAMYANPRSIELADVEELVMAKPEDNIFAWIDLAVRGQAAEALWRLDDVLLAGNDLFAALALLARQWRLIYFAKRSAAVGEQSRITAQRVGVPPFALKKASEQGGRLSLRMVEDMLVAVADVEWELKTGRRDPRQALEWLVLQFAHVQGGGAREKAGSRAQ